MGFLVIIKNHEMLRVIYLAFFLVVMTLREADAQICMLCKTAIKQVKTLDITPEEIGQVCDLLYDSDADLKEQCEGLATEEGAEALNDDLSKLDPKDVCKKIGLC